jgi:serine/threonine protein kinase
MSRYGPSAPILAERFTDQIPLRVGSRFRHVQARDVHSGRRVVLTVPADPGASWTAGALARAAAVHARVGSHPHVVALCDELTAADGAPVLVFERCAGSLADLPSPRRPSVRAVIALTIKLCGALEAVHAAGFAHTDLRPRNIYVRNGGEPALAGLTEAIRLCETPDHALHRTSPFTAPEALEGRPATEATDVYGLAATMYDLLAGHPAFPALGTERQAETSLRILRGARAPLPTTVPLALADVLAWAMAVDPAKRPPTPAWLAEELRHYEHIQGWTRTAPVSA